MYKYLLCVVLLTLGSCQSEDTVAVKKYFDLKGYLDLEIIRLKSLKPSVHKFWYIKQEKESKIVSELNFANELALFLDADINKSAFLKSYEVAENKTLKIYTLKPSENLKVKLLKVELDDKGKVKLIKIETETANYLYKSSTKLILKTVEGHIKEYNIESNQKLFFGDIQITKIEGIIS